jgi:hypothetical protein
MTQRETSRRVPADSFRIRLAIVRTEMGWNYDQAQAATGVGSESWRQWEKGLRHCTDVIGVSRKIAEATPFDQTWLALGGPLSQDGGGGAPIRPSRRFTGASLRRVNTQSSGGYVNAERGYAFADNLVAAPIAA